ncbi:AAC(3) family N-acetyltransferase [Scytonema hofmannii FACHB-248]|uniref:Aminoglycoside N(3)-acetyltransferase n=1 Tax=Scytonema hofmannii FACHB-248 TaxID=1842502 RepID=A0ABR8GW83_9CYAN|nr:MULTISPECIES: AAC(3) family N-acetyltransferase [Nostocales]MBD2607447.1 AAC(3) family N-acetyltransferase [Scytonema hofmannii FACHB-248]
MSEENVISRTLFPCTCASLTDELQQIGLAPGMTLLIHSSLSSLGWVCGGSIAVVQVLMDVLTTTSTLVMPTHSGDYSDPSEWENPPVPSEWWQTIRDTMPAFDARLTPTLGMGKIPESFRTYPDVLRSNHPSTSFAAWGQNAQMVIKDHAYDDSLGKDSPLAHLYDLDAWVLLLGVGYDSNTCFHLAEYQVKGEERIFKGAPIMEAGQRVWKTYKDIEFESEDFEEIGNAFEQAGYVKIGKVGQAQTKLFSLKSAVDWAAAWLKNKQDNSGKNAD